MPAPVIPQAREGVPPGPSEGALRPEDERLLDRIADRVVGMSMTVPAILFLESVKPLSFVGSQALYFFEPMVRAFFTVPEYERFAALLERRETLEALLVRIEAKDQTARQEVRERKARLKAEKEARKRKESL